MSILIKKITRNPNDYNGNKKHLQRNITQKPKTKKISANNQESFYKILESEVAQKNSQTITKTNKKQNANSEIYDNFNTLWHK